MNVIIIEDEQRAANLLVRLIRETDSSIRVMAKLESVKESITFLGKTRDIDLIFSDIELSDGLSFQIFNSVEVTCPVIFTTAFDEYAIDAFKTNGIDYLLEPIEQVDLRVALEKYKRIFRPESKPDLESLANLLQERKDKYKNRFMVRVGDKIKTIDVEEIVVFYSMEKASFLLNAQGRHYALDMSLDQIQGLIDPDGFFRINRKFIVALKHISEVVTWSASRLKVIIPEFEGEPLIVARERTRDFKIWLGN